MNVRFIKWGLPLMFVAACNNPKAAEPATIATEKVTQFFDVAGMDTSVKPGNNFFEYANGAWLKITTIPNDQTGWGSFYTLYESNQKALKTILEKAAATNNAKGSLEQKVGDFYAAGMDTIGLEKIGVTPVKAVIAKIDSVNDINGIMPLATALYASGESHGLLGFYVGADEKNSQRNLAIFSQSGLSLPEKDYYTKQDSASIAARAALVTYAKQLFVLSGKDEPTAIKAANELLALETMMATSHLKPAETRDPIKNYNKMSLVDLDKAQPNIGWSNFFKAMNATVDSVNIQQPKYYEALNKLIAPNMLSVFKSKLAFVYLSNNASLLNKAMRDAAFNFSKVFSGQKTDNERWKKMVSRVDGSLGDLLGQLYVKTYFTEAAKKRMDELVSNLQKAFAIRIQKSEWMSDSTKAIATIKLNSFLKKIGYTTKWKSYDDVSIDRNDFFNSAKSISKHEHAERIAKLSKPVDKTDWDMTPPTVNAYYNPTNNEIVFPAGILQFPFFDVNADDAINYGGIGMVIGHEMTHGFDDQGSQYDYQGNLKNWWAKGDDKKFNAKTAMVVKQYNAYTLFGNMHVNGALTLGENIADFGGIAIAYDAFKMTKQGQSNEKIDGFTPDQRFFLGYAQIWRIKTRDETMRTRLLTDPHSPEVFRINGPLANFDPFYAAFNVQVGDSMYIAPANRARIW
ncbi:M13 family metallopeptidase [Ferruginibacter yonginensis]|uniref:M13 family metallopeptidase n=1 Tax=Ferruginibacter yonginensis TaxID=1310416 RepID=A0ABV8QQR4_9BACT